MSAHIAGLLERFRSRGIVLDANVFTLLVLGANDRRMIPRHKRTRSYTTDDFDLLVRFVGQFKTIITNPNILTEVSNLMEGALGIVQQLANRIESMEERYIKSRDAIQWDRSLKFGITDSVIAIVAAKIFWCLPMISG